MILKKNVKKKERFAKIARMKLTPLILFSLIFSVANSQDLILTDPIKKSMDSDIHAFRCITDSMMHVAGTGFYKRDEKVGMCGVYDDDYGGWDHHFYGTALYPIDGYKRTVCGQLFHKDDYDDVLDNGDGDFTTNLIPDPSFSWLVSESLNSEPNAERSIHIEINVNSTVGENLISEDDYLTPAVETCAYGVWVTDKGHPDWHPEIHPAEQFWQAKTLSDGNTNYSLRYLLDNGGRFESDDDYNCVYARVRGNPDMIPADLGTPHIWAPNPLNGSFYIAFSVPLHSQKHYDYWLNDKSSNIILPLDANSKDIVQLIYKDSVLVTVHNPSNSKYRAEIYDVTSDGVNLMGYVKISARIGFEGEGGYAYLDVLEQVNNTGKQSYSQQYAFIPDSLEKLPLDGVQGYQTIDNPISLFDGTAILTIPASLTNFQSIKIGNPNILRPFIISASLNETKSVGFKIDNIGFDNSGSILLSWNSDDFSCPCGNDFAGEILRKTFVVNKTTDLVKTDGTTELVDTPLYQFKITFKLTKLNNPSWPVLPSRIDH
jgi:hypothetical protein